MKTKDRKTSRHQLVLDICADRQIHLADVAEEMGIKQPTLQYTLKAPAPGPIVHGRLMAWLRKQLECKNVTSITRRKIAGHIAN